MKYLISYSFGLQNGGYGTGCVEIGTKWWKKLNSKHLVDLRKKLSSDLHCDKDKIVFIGIYKF